MTVIYSICTHYNLHLSCIETQIHTTSRMPSSSTPRLWACLSTAWAWATVSSRLWTSRCTTNPLTCLKKACVRTTCVSSPWKNSCSKKRQTDRQTDNTSPYNQLFQKVGGTDIHILQIIWLHEMRVINIFGLFSWIRKTVHFLWHTHFMAF